MVSILSSVLSGFGSAVVARDGRVGVLQFGGVGGAGSGIELAEHRVIQRVSFELGDLAVGGVEIAEDNGLGGAGLLAGRAHLARADTTVFLFGVDPGGADTLNAIGAFLH